jgi:phospholipid/cholesterol/gamma-HCH transport system substrate-binding protein
MITTRNARVGLAAAMTLILAMAIVVASRPLWHPVDRLHIVAYFENTNGVFPGDEVRILGVPVGKIDTIEPQPTRAKVSFWVDHNYKVPAEAKAAIISPMLVTARAIQLLPAYTGNGPTMQPGAVIPEERTAVPVEFDDLRRQLQRLTQTLQPTQPGGVSPLGALINTTADNLRGQGADIRDSLIKLSHAVSVFADQRDDVFGTIKHLSILVSALQSSTDLMRHLNEDLAAVTALLANDPDEVGTAITDAKDALSDVRSFISTNRDALGATSDKLASLTQALVDSLDDIKQALHILPTVTSNAINAYNPAQGSLTAALAINNFADPITFICGAVQAASRLGAEQAAKLCVQYLAPIIKNRQYNFPPIGFNPFVGATMRPNEITYSEDRLRPDYVAPQPAPPPGPPLAAEAPQAGAAPAADPQSGPANPALSVATNPAAGLPGIMVPPGAGQ